jgi:cytochrome P450
MLIVSSKSILPTFILHNPNPQFQPKDATIVIPQWALHHSKYEEAGAFNPDRYTNHPNLAPDYAGIKDFENRDHYSYGAGRRICAGIQLAERTQWRHIARILWAFRIEHSIDESTGEKIPIDLDAYDNKLVSGPLPFKVKFTPRSQQHIDVIKNEMGNAREILRAWE